MLATVLLGNEGKDVDMSKLQQAYGNWVVGDRFWDRVEDIALFTDRLDEGAHLLLVAQRRMGKTSLMREAARRLEERYLCLFVDWQKARSAADAVVDLSLEIRPHHNLWEKSRSVFSNILDRLSEAVERVDLGELGITLRAGLNSGNWKDKGDRLFAILAASEKPVVLMLDEAPILVNRLLKGDDYTITPERRANTDEFMSWLRENSIRHRGKIRIVISGSIGLEPVLRQARLSASLNTFSPFELKPWDEIAAIGCIEALSNTYGVKLGEGAAAAMVNRLGCAIPHHVQMFFTHVHDRCKRRGNMEFAREEVDELYENEMLGIRGHSELTHYEDRLKLVLGPEALALALEMLTETAVTNRLTRESLSLLRMDYVFPDRNAQEVQEEILRVLEHDGYLQPMGQEYRFVSSLLRDWWKGRYGAFYTPVASREDRS